MVASMFPQIIGNDVQKESSPAAPLVFGYPAQPSTTTASPSVSRQPPTAAPSNLMMPDLMTPQSPRPLHTQHSYLDHQATDDVLAAASVLSNGNSAHFDMFYNQKQQGQALVPQAPPSSHQFEAPPTFANHGIHNRAGVFDGMAFHSPPAGSQPYSRRPPRRVSEIHFGSDPNFSNEKFISQSARDTTAAMAEEQLAALQCLERTDSAAPTRAASPSTAWAPMSPNTARRSSMVSPIQLKTESYDIPTPIEPGNGETGPPAKRRRNNKTAKETRHAEPNPPRVQPPATAEQAQPQPLPQYGSVPEYKRRKLPEPLTPEAETVTTAAATKRRRKSPPPSTTTTNDAKTNGAGSAAGGGRRKASQAKPPREPLNEDQKRENHIRSEQKRRGIISRGYDMLYELVPALREGRTHKAHALQCAADFIETLAAGNERLRELLDEAGLDEDDGSGEGFGPGTGKGTRTGSGSGLGSGTGLETGTGTGKGLR
ncbi:hypothetical protein N658DRAFT_59925 [Parathielavia hyrcaniae]|uniref:BHLH domain-containing protein n=1 Tax=Parathielavia hyrcaniae TaxID=113614 RepID=A0AAN6Q0T7_9PEZI|nr:hypothetical protein N658DRAFT_59925 [Parathielavia hyrcaniae]